MILFRADAIFASSVSKYCKSLPFTDREDLSSSKVINDLKTVF